MAMRKRPRRSKGDEPTTEPATKGWSHDSAQRLRDELRMRRELLLTHHESRVTANAEEAAAGEENVALFDLAPVPLLLLDENGIVRRGNRAAATLLDVGRTRLLGAPLVTFIGESDRRPFLDHMRRCRTSEDMVQTELTFRRRQEGEIPVELSSRLVVVPHIGLRAYHTTAIDLRDRRHAEIERQRAAELRQRAEREREALRATNESKDRFLAMLSHELRTPLTPVLLATSAWKDDPSLAEPVRHALAMIHRNVATETRLIDDLLDLTRVMQGKLSLQPVAVDLRPLVEEVAEGLTHESDAKDHALALDLDARQRVYGDPVRVRQIVGNLLRNAVRFTPPGGRILVATRDVDTGFALISVSDTGVGFDPGSTSTLFEPFQQGARGATSGGLGLGLAITKGLVEAHGGSLQAFSDGPGQGARFVVRLPTCAGQDVAATPPALPAPARGTEPLAILLVEDHEDSGDALSYVLRHEGYEVVLARSVAEALQLAEHATFDVLVSDLGLPDGSGLDVIRALRARKPICGIALTGFGRREDVAKTRAGGFDHHLTKPIDLPTLVAAIESLRPRIVA